MSSAKYEKYIGRTLDNRYRIDALIGIGGMAVVFNAFDEKEGKQVALKLLREEIASDVASVKRFINESKAVARLDHPNIVKIYNVAVSDEYKYIVMEYIEGITLKKYMTKKGALSSQIVLAISEQVLSALEHAHSKGIIHRDIKPHNIMLLKNGKVVVTDFGIAQLDKNENDMGDEKAVGTVFYISPEQASGKPTDERSDLYSLGAMMYEMATGKLPFYAEKPLDVARMQINDEPTLPREINSSIPKGLEQIILEAMKKDPSLRFQSASEMLEYVRALHDDPFAVFEFGEVEEEIEEESEPVKKVIHKERSGSIFPVVCGACLACLIVAIIAAYYAFVHLILPSDLNVFKHDTTGEIVVGAYVEREYSNELAKSLRAEGYSVNVVYRYNEDYASGIICEQDPVADSVRKKGKFTLTLTVSKGIESEKIANYSMSEYRVAKLSLEKLGFNVKVQTIKNDAIDTGYVVGTEPVAGSTVPKGALVIVYVSSGPEIENTVVPDFSGMTIDAMREFFKSSDLRLGNVTHAYSDSFDEGLICNQFPLPDSVVAKGEFINLTISDGLISDADDQGEDDGQGEGDIPEITE